jgi:glycosyltransferase involved in cell wall biosynthesis
MQLSDGMTSTKSESPLRVLTFTTLYPNAAMPQHGVFVENRLRQLIGSGEVCARVLAPVPYFPSRNSVFGRYATLAGVPLAEIRHGIAIDHPRFFTIPKLGMSAAPYLLYASARRALSRMIRAHQNFDLIDAHYFYPDGVAAVMLARSFGLPVVITARGTDINVLPNYAAPRRMIRWAAKHADRLIAVSDALATKLTSLGISESRVTVLRNGVDATLFHPTSPYPIGESTPSPLAVSVGNLVPLKGHDLVISAVQQIENLKLWVVGNGPERGRLEALARELGVDGRVRFLGSIPHERMPEIYSAADFLVLASEREGWPNVLLEAMACGARVVATNVSDVAKIVGTRDAGIWIAQRSVTELVKALRELMNAPVTRAATRAHALRFGWHPTTRGQIDLFKAIKAGVLAARGAHGADAS